METIKNTAIGLTLFIFLTLIFPSCSSTTEPLADNSTPGRRDYTWTVDTLINLGPHCSFDGIWGTSPTNVWVKADITNDGTKTIWHYDGQNWKLFSYSSPNGYVTPYSIFGLSADNFWVGGDENDIWRYKNGNFARFGIYEIENYGPAIFQKIWGEEENNIYAVGAIYNPNDLVFYGVILHYDGEKWEYTYKPNPAIDMQFKDIKRGTNDSKDYFVVGFKVDNVQGDSVGLFKYDGKSLTKIYSEGLTADIHILPNYPGMLKIGNDIYFGFKEKIYRYKNGGLVTCLDFTGQNISDLANFYGRSTKDLFISMKDGIGHYNGSNLQTIFKYKYVGNVGCSDAAIFENEVFFLCHDLEHFVDFIVHGKLK
jgi:hypothetical protein